MDQYDEAEEGALDGEEIEGTVDESSVRMKELIAEAEHERATRRQQLDREREVTKAVLLEDIEGTGDTEIIKVEERGGEKWDCESILSTYSTLYNHPKLISEPKNNKIQLSSKTGIPKGVLGRGLTSQALQQLDRDNLSSDEDDLVSVRSKISELSVRPKHETPEEKKERNKRKSITSRKFMYEVRNGPSKIRRFMGRIGSSHKRLMLRYAMTKKLMRAKGGTASRPTRDSEILLLRTSFRSISSI